MTEAAQVFAAYVLADAVAALYHLFTDRGWNIQSQVEYFLNHHDRPWTMTFDLQPLIAGIPIMLCGLLAAPWFLCSFGLFVSFAQVPHYYTHHPAPWPVKALQRARIFLNPKAHASHHKGAFDRDFCVVSGWNNWWVNWLAKKVPAV